MASRPWRAAALGLIAAALAGGAAAKPFALRTVGADTAVAIDLQSVRRDGGLRTGWSYELLRERNPLAGERTQIIAVLEQADCRAERVRHLQIVHYRASGKTLWRVGPQPGWREVPGGSETDLVLQALCGRPGRAWARREAASVFELYRKAWGGRFSR